jgi:hypothetical protein
VGKGTLHHLGYITISGVGKEEIGKILIEMEKKYLNIFEEKYNINPFAGKIRLWSNHSEKINE